VSGGSELPEPSVRVADARRRAAERRRRQRARLRPLGWLAIAVVAIPAATGDPRPGLTGAGLGVALALVAYVAAVALTILREPPPARTGFARLLVPLVVGGAGLALAGLQPHGLVEVAPSVAVWTAVVRLRPRLAAPIAVAVVGGLDIVIAATGDHVAQSIAAATLLCLVLAASAYLMRQATDNRDEIDRLLAELEDAREAELRSAAVEERGRIARELHDVLAHSLSALTIQLEGARLLAKRDGASSAVGEALERAGGLAKEGLADARRAVGALRAEDEPAPAIDELPKLVGRFRQLDLDVTLDIEGQPRPLATETNLALYRAAQEALTNALRYARDAQTTVTLRYGDADVALAVENRRSAPSDRSPAAAVGGGKGLTGMRERVEALGGRMLAGDTGSGFRVEVEVPA